MIAAIDIIILSNAKNEKLKSLTIQTIASLFESEDPEKIKFNVLVIESFTSLNPYQYQNATTIYPDSKFGYHKYLNIGIKLTNNPFICLCNNDLIFHKNWATEILKEMDSDPELLNAHPCSPELLDKAKLATDGPLNGGYFGPLFGWCIFAQRKVFEKTGLLDEQLTFWYADNDYYNTLKKYGIKNKLILNSHVKHLGSESLTRLNVKEHIRLTQLPRLYFSYKWHHHNYIRYKLETLFYKMKILFASK